jgi:hypothetical protein
MAEPGAGQASTGSGEGIDWLLFYNRRRPRAALGYLGPLAFGKNGLPIKKGAPHHRSAKRGHGQPMSLHKAWTPFHRS